MKIKTAFVVLGLLASSSFAQANGVAYDAASVMQTIVQSQHGPQLMDLINCKVGDSASYQVQISGLPFGGTMEKSVTKDEGAAIWVKTQVNLMIQKETVDTLINKADGKVLKMLRNGQEQQIPEAGDVEIVSQEYEDVTVPAGTFPSMHVVIKTKDLEHAEIWVNPRDTVMEGMLKQVMTPKQNNQMTITMVLTRFKRN